jgi:hypothetical protein
MLQWLIESHAGIREKADIFLGLHSLIVHSPDTKLPFPAGLRTSRIYLSNQERIFS